MEYMNIEELRNNGKYLDNIPEIIDEDDLKQYIGKYMSVDEYKRLYDDFKKLDVNIEYHNTGKEWIVKLEWKDHSKDHEYDEFYEYVKRHSLN